ncbi:penicillin-binding protein 1C [Chondromyces crocatus]|uniref:peptidoglycan glycosyltransferase n=1 Tax=Chondromyces crocatus TaxID=52 RepID=A0A0K1EGN8_CHOCO|nr:penicillin-binding protein 1C [Chondromyces crocatus]AKT39847.1 glycosyl transferase [Chondromyces crocatus]
MSVVARRGRRALKVAVVLLVAPWLVLALWAVVTPLPSELTEGAEGYDVSVVFRDRHGVMLRELRAGDGARARWVPLSAMGERIQRALLAAEDRRFAVHPGVDPLAMARALGQLCVEGRVVSGASTLTQQLARTVRPRPRTVRGKLSEMALALRIEASLSKREILEQYLNRVMFGPGVRGVEAASRFYFDKGTAELSLAEAAALSALPRGPALYDPRRGTERLLRRRDRILERMEAGGLATAEEVASARAEPIGIARRGGSLGAPHLVYAVLSGAADPVVGALRDRASEVTLSIERGLQRELEVLSQEVVQSLAAREVSAASVVVLDNATGEILAYVGSPDAEDARRLGQNDGVLARRQPGSSLKPFVYGLAMERLGYDAGTVLPDVALELPLPSGGSYAPQNYDGRFHGPVRLREALANSYNVPAVWAAAALGPERVLTRLREVGLSTLDREASHYGVAIALGDGEVRLLDLAAAYATLARGGLFLPARAVLGAQDRAGEALALPVSPAPVQVLDAVRTRIITDILSDRRARIGAFGEGSVLELPFEAAVKTGTSKGFRDNIAVGYTPAVTVAVWVGNFDGSPMNGVSGVTGAGPLLHEALVAASRVRPAMPFAAPDPEATVEVEICALSGQRPASVCPHRRREWLPREEVAALPACEMHEVVRVDRQTGLLAGPLCRGDEVEERVVERFDARLSTWARAAGRPLAPEGVSPRCGELPVREGAASRGLALLFPADGARFVIDAAVGSVQAIRLRAAIPAGARNARFVIGGRVIAAPLGWADFQLVRGVHRVRAEADGVAPSEVMEFSVE